MDDPSTKIERQPVSRVLDVVLAAILVPFAAVVSLLIVPCVYFSMGAPVLFRQERMGRGGRAFQLIKFRSMTDARGEDGTLLADELRVTPAGKFLRFSRLDELPELYNILKGEMSFIGPRPLLPHTVEEMGVLGRVRSSVRPGLTGWAQISGNSVLSNDDKLALDLWYIRHRSFCLDLYILAMTLGVMLFKEMPSAERIAAAHKELAERTG